MAKYKVKFLIPGSNPGNPTKTKGETMKWKVDHENLTVNIYDCITDEEFEIYTDEPGRSLSYYFEKDYTFKCKLKGGITIEICDYTMCFKNRATKKNDYVECMADQFRLRESLNILISAYGVEEE